MLSERLLFYSPRKVLNGIVIEYSLYESSWLRHKLQDCVSALPLRGGAQLPGRAVTSAQCCFAGAPGT